MSNLAVRKLSHLWQNAAKCLNLSRSNQHLAAAKYAQTLLNLPETRITQLSNGFRIATQTTDAPTSTVGIWLDAGSRYEVAENNGACHFLEHIALKGSKQKSRQDLEKEIGNLGAQFRSYTDREEMAIYAKCLSGDALKVVTILGDSINHIKIDDETVERERKIILSELDAAESDLRQVTFDYLHLTAFQGTPMEKSPLGNSNSIQNMSKEVLANFARNNLIAPRMVLCATGKVNHDELVKTAEKSFADIPYTYTEEIPTLPYCRFTGSEVRVREDWYPFAHCAAVVNTCGFGHPDTYPLMVAKASIGNWDKTMLSSLDTSVPMIHNISKEKRCHGFESFHLLYRDTGIWGNYFVMDKMILDDYMFNLQNEWMKLCVNVTDVELHMAKTFLRSNLLLAHDQQEVVCADIAKQVLLSGEHESFDELDEKIQSVTLQQLRDTCSKYIYDRCPAIACIGPVEGFPDYNRVRSSMYWMRY